ncbi:MAG: L,D-transpeptidase family protein [Deltaproteobacteria bacterium]|nr:L,D-transpeptidase family protein [Deltaproteobacteria bacterium]
MIKPIVIFSITVAALLLFPMAVSADRLDDEIRQSIQLKMVTASGYAVKDCSQNGLCQGPMVSRFYKGRDFYPAWINTPRPAQIESLLRVIRNADQEGLRPREYHLEKLEKGVDDWRRMTKINEQDIDSLATLDVLLTDAFFRLGLHLYAGCLDYGSLSPEWGVPRKRIDVVKILEDTLKYSDVEIVLKGFAPRHHSYAGLRAVLRRYRQIAAAGGWPILPAKAAFNKEQKDMPVMMLYERLLASGDMDPYDGHVSHVFDDVMKEGVQKFQRRHGLNVDGSVGAETLKHLNVSVEDVIRRIELNMDRIRWFADDPGERYVFVNIADYSLEMIDRQQSVLDMRIVAGTDKNRSYVLSDKIIYLELNPFWNIPESITEKEMLPKIKENPQFLNAKKIKVIKGWSEPSVEVRPDEIDWTAVRGNKFPYRLRQEPGPKNPLGRIKFVFPNKYDVYLHDTTEKHLFNRKKRTLSHGCIRIEKPLDLAVLLLPPDRGWTRQKFQDDIRKGKRVIVRLPEAAPVHIVYWTAWADRDGVLQIRDDVYGLDKLWP